MSGSEAPSFETLTRPCVRSVTPYLPGKPIAEVQRELGIRRVIKLASNENPLGPSPKAVAAARRALRQTHLYPEGASPLLRRALARELGILEYQVLIGNGSDEIIRLLCEAFLSPEDEAVVSQRGFIRFKQQSLLMGARVIEVPMRDWTHDLEAMARSVGPKTKLMFVASPNNPTGTYNTRDQVKRFLESVPSSVLVVLDEAYCHYAACRSDYPDSVREFFPGRRNLAILRTFSKAYGLAGLRVGYGIADAELVGWLDRIRMPFNVNLVGQWAALAAVEDRVFLRRSVAANRRGGRSLSTQLRRLGLQPGDSGTNFLFLRSPIPGNRLFQELLRSGVIVRPLDEYGLTHHVRISIGTPAQNGLLVSALKKALTLS
ncbi:MAG: histidinol-phosphate transaminase [Elusimicrobia bacterium]|nr:histidinol-phosphate transaminase [Elusimicrobiota bacterium]